jgi:hypothetical protein
MIAGAAAFNAGILLFSDTEPIVPRRIPHQSRRIFHREFHSPLGSAHSIFVIGESVDWARTAFEGCEQAMDGIPPEERTIERMRETIEQSLTDNRHGHRDGEPTEQELLLFLVLYSPCQQRYSLFRGTSTTLREVVGYDCQGPAAYLGHYLIRDRYSAARSLDELNLTTVFSVAADTLTGVRDAHEACGASSELIVMYADGQVSAVQLMSHDSPTQRAVTLTRLSRSCSGHGVARASSRVRAFDRDVTSRT